MRKQQKPTNQNVVARVAVFSVSSQRENARAKGKSRKRMGREQKEERGEGVAPPSSTNFFVTSVPEPSRDPRLPERKRKRPLRRLKRGDYFS